MTITKRKHICKIQKFNEAEKNTNKAFSLSGLSGVGEIKYLGVNSYPIIQFEKISVLNVKFQSIESDMQTILNLWSSRGLTLLGKITVL